MEEEKVEKQEEVEKGEGVSKRPVRPQKKNNVALIVIILLIIAAIGIGVYFVGKDKDNKPVDKKESEVKKPELKSEFRLSGNGLEKFDLYFLQLENEEKNKVYSPLSIKYALEMLAEGADGDTKAQLDAIIGDYVAKKYTNSKNMSFANAFFVRDTFKDSIRKDYSDLLKNKYNAELILDSFKNPENINNWVNEKTLNMIPKLVESVDDNDFFLINALAIDMEWVKKIQSDTGEEYNVQFKHEKVKADDDDNEWNKENGISGVSVYPLDSVDYTGIKFEGFAEKAKSAEIAAVANKYDAVKEIGEENVRKTINSEYSEWLKSEEGKECSKGVPEDYPQDVSKYVDKFVKDLNSNYKHMSSSTDFLFYDDSDVKVFAKDLKEYNGTTLQYVGIMPKTEKLTDFISSTNSSKLNEYIKNLKDMSLNSFEDGYMTIIEGYIPMFKMDYELDLMGDLQKIGVKDIFDSEKANLSKMISEKEYIDTALHKANIEFSNEGIKASAATALGGAGSTSCGFEHRYEVPLKKINITFDKPYMYLVRDKESGEVWFTGTVYSPVTYIPAEGGM